MRWITRLEQAPVRFGGPVAWLAAHAEAAGWPLPAATPHDLADAASAKREGGAPRLLRRRMLRALTAQLFDIHPEGVRFARTPQGAPALVAPSAFISTAGCEGWSAVAIGPCPLGVDIQSMSEGEPAELRRWTLVEAYLKRLGEGLALDPEHVRVSADGEGAFRLAVAEREPAAGWLYEDRRVVVAVAVGRTEPAA